jgi:aminobenzoyl-glutamate transport protein
MTEQAARLFDPDYSVNPACNWWFKIASTLVLTLTGWAVAALVVERRFRAPADVGIASDRSVFTLTREERGGLVVAVVAMVLVLAVFVASASIEGGFLYDPPIAVGEEARNPTWIAAIVPLLFVLFLVPGLAYGIRTGTIRSDRDVTRMMSEFVAVLAGYVVLAFFASILVAAFERSNLGVMLAIEGGNFLKSLDLPRWALLLAFIALTCSLDLFVVSMSAKWAMLATIFVPMFMTLGLSPELTQATYRIGDSITNPVSPLNPYLIVVLAFLQQHEKKAGLGTLIALVLPYALAFALVWPALLLVWVALGLPLGPGGPLAYDAG